MKYQYKDKLGGASLKFKRVSDDERVPIVVEGFRAAV